MFLFKRCIIAVLRLKPDKNGVLTQHVKLKVSLTDCFYSANFPCFFSIHIALHLMILLFLNLLLKLRQVMDSIGVCNRPVQKRHASHCLVSYQHNYLQKKVKI